MRRELEDKLAREFPQLFADRNKSPHETLMCWGCECCDGWYDILYTMCTELMTSDLPKEFRFTQIKEKFGTLRVYSMYYTNEIEEIIDKTEGLSAYTCEICGNNKDARATKDRWIRTLCPTCQKKIKKDYSIRWHKPLEGTHEDLK